MVAVWFIAGASSYMLYQRVMLRILRKWFAAGKEERIRKDVFAKMNFDSLLTFKNSVEAEIRKRREPSSPA